MPNLASLCSQQLQRPAPILLGNTGSCGLVTANTARRDEGFHSRLQIILLTQQHTLLLHNAHSLPVLPTRLRLLYIRSWPKHIRKEFVVTTICTSWSQGNGLCLCHSTETKLGHNTGITSRILYQQQQSHCHTNRHHIVTSTKESK